MALGRLWSDDGLLCHQLIRDDRLGGRCMSSSVTRAKIHPSNGECGGIGTAPMGRQGEKRLEAKGTVVVIRVGKLASNYLRARQPPFGISGAGDGPPGSRHCSWLSYLTSHCESARTCSWESMGYTDRRPSHEQPTRPLAPLALQSFRAINFQLCRRCWCRLGLTLVAPFVDERCTGEAWHGGSGPQHSWAVARVLVGRS